jgi:hypothetical protein
MDAAARTIVFVNLAHVFTHYGLLVLATAVLAMVVQEPATFGTLYGPILALGTGCSWSMAWARCRWAGWRNASGGRGCWRPSSWAAAPRWRWPGWRPGR